MPEDKSIIYNGLRDTWRRNGLVCAARHPERVAVRANAQLVTIVFRLNSRGAAHDASSGPQPVRYSQDVRVIIRALYGPNDYRYSQCSCLTETIAGCVIRACRDQRNAIRSGLLPKPISKGVKAIIAGADSAALGLCFLAIIALKRSAQAFRPQEIIDLLREFSAIKGEWCCRIGMRLPPGWNGNRRRYEAEARERQIVRPYHAMRPWKLKSLTSLRRIVSDG